MSYRPSEKALEVALRHLSRYGDTDIFPHLPELVFFANQEQEIVNELKKPHSLGHDITKELLMNQFEITPDQA
jgi:hypothetical protein